jgi:hypothetical protein
MFRWAAIISAVIFIVAVAGAILSSQKSIEPIHQQTAEKSEKEATAKNEKVALFDRWLPDSTAVFNLFLMIFTGVLAFGGLIQLNLLTRAERIATETANAAKESANATKQAVELSDRTAERQLRAYMSPSGGTIQNFDLNKLAPDISVRIEFKNSGQTPAYDFSANGGATFANFPLSKILEKNEKAAGPTVIGPQGEYILTVGISGMTQAQLDAIKTREYAIFVHGVYSYRDAFNKTRTGKFRFFYGGAGGLRSDYALTFDQEGNSAD